jgi:glycosyltransferase involved in cell wall biosynthesis
MARSVLIVTPSLDRGGAERHSTWLATTVDRTRWSPHVLAFAGGPLEAELVTAGVPVTVVSAGGLRGTRAATAAVRAALDAVRPDLVTGQNIAVDLAVRPALREHRVPYLVWKHTYGHIGYRGMRERLVEAVTGSLVTRYGAVCHTQVRYLVDELGLPPQKISVVPNAVPVPEAAPAAPTGPPTVLMVAAMRADKGHALVLDAWSAVLAAVPGARLQLAGDGPCRSDLEAQARRLSIDGSVDFLGVRGDVAALLASASLLVLASYAVECFPYAVLEAMAAGRGVVSTDVAGLPEMVDDGSTGRLVPPDDPVALAEGIVEGLTDDRAAAIRWGRAGWERAGQVFPFHAWSRGMGDVFDKVASAGPGVAGDPSETTRTPGRTRQEVS